MKKVILVLALLAIGCTQQEDLKPCECTYIESIEVREDSELLRLKNDCRELSEEDSFVVIPIQSFDYFNVGDCVEMD